MLIWTVGAGGLFGRALVERIERTESLTNFHGDPINWGDPHQVQSAFNAGAERLALQAGEANWGLIWAAGQASTSTDASQTQKELASLKALLAALNDYGPRTPGKFFLTSSAGGVYAGSQNPPFNDTAEPHPLSAYGQLKLDQENAVKDFVRASQQRTTATIGRVSNLYGPGQNLEKLQGLISQLVISTIYQRPINIFVSLDTLRDYIYSDDAAKVALHFLTQEQEVRPPHETKVIASGLPTSIGYLIQVVQNIAREKILVALGDHSSSRGQALDLRLIPSDRPETHALVSTNLPAGIKNTYLDLLQRHQLGSTERNITV